MTKRFGFRLAALVALGATSQFAQTNPAPECGDLPTHADLKTALIAAQKLRNGGLGFHMWATVVNRDGVVCAVAFSGATRGDQWPGSRVISAQKASTANAFSLPTFALSTANLHTATQNGGTLFGLQLSNPVDTHAAYGGTAAKFGEVDDPLVGLTIGGVNVFGGGLGLYRQGSRRIVGGLGVSGDTSCTDHIIAWRVRDALGLDNVPAGVAGTGADNMIHDLVQNQSTGQTSSPSGYGHPTCDATATGIANSLPSTVSLGPNITQ